jgi:hypothetical protein
MKSKENRPDASKLAQGPSSEDSRMSGFRNFDLVRAMVVSSGLAQALFWIFTLQIFRNGLLPFDLVFFWLTLPTLLLCLLGEAVPLAAGLAAASFSINSGLLILLLALG